MRLNVRQIGGKYTEVKVDETDTGFLDYGEARALAIHLLEVAEEILYDNDIDEPSYVVEQARVMAEAKEYDK